MDRAYKEELPSLKISLEKLREEFSNLTLKTNWSQLRIDPLLRHLESLNELLDSPEFSKEFLHLRKGVVLFHSDLVYFRANVKGLKEILKSEKKATGSRKNKPRKN